MSVIFLCLLFASSAVCGPIAPFETRSILAGNDALRISRLKDTVAQEEYSEDTATQSSASENEGASSSIELALVGEDKLAPTSDAIAEQGYGSQSEADLTAPVTEPSSEILPKKLVYEELPVGTTPDPNEPEIGPDGKVIPLRPWGETVGTTAQPTATSAAPTEENVSPTFLLHIAKLSEAKALPTVPTTNNPNFFALPGASGATAGGSDQPEATKGATGSTTGESDQPESPKGATGSITEEATNGQGEKIVKNGKTRGQGSFPPREEPEEECDYVEDGFAPCGFLGYVYVLPYPYASTQQFYAQGQNPGVNYGCGQSDCPINAPYAHQAYFYPS
uniref:Uncharacterized protein n=1 Tax=Plectus sambesii TaxID=2011161 RepID=A0A914XDS1_9BILA